MKLTEIKLTDIPTGSKLELEVYNNLGEKVRPALISELEWCEGEDTAYIAAPILEGILYPLHVDTEMEVCAYIKDDIYRFRAKVTRRGLKDNIAIIRINVAGNIVKVQRRQFFRFVWSIPMTYRVVESLDPKYNTDVPFKNAVTKDMSGGGLSIGLEEKIELGKLVECELPLTKKTVRFIGKVTRSVKRPEEEIYKFEIGINFKKIEYKDREYIIRYIFQEQRKLRKKGLI